MTRRFLSPGERQMLAQATPHERQILRAFLDELDAHLTPNSEPPAPRAVEYHAASLWEEHHDRG